MKKNCANAVGMFSLIKRNKKQLLQCLEDIANSKGKYMREHQGKAELVGLLKDAE